MQLKEFLPPIVLRGLARIQPTRYGWFGNYASWQDAMKDSSGYSDEKIAQKVLEAVRKVTEGKASYERDSVTFDKMDYPWPVLSGILWTAARRGGKVNVMDFGGSLGSTYYNLRNFLVDLEVQWHVVEQERFVALGKAHFQDSHLKFFTSTAESISGGQPDVILLSSVLPYLQEPYDILRELIRLSAPCMIFDKMPFLLEGTRDRLTIQRVNPAIYPASYPAWFFQEEAFLDLMNKDYERTAEFTNEDTANIPAVFKGFIFRKRA